MLSICVHDRPSSRSTSSTRIARAAVMPSAMVIRRIRNTQRSNNLEMRFSSITETPWLAKRRDDDRRRCTSQQAKPCAGSPGARTLYFRGPGVQLHPRAARAARPSGLTRGLNDATLHHMVKYRSAAGARMITISAFKWVPDFARGQVRDLRVRWALEEAGLPYTTRLLEQGDQDQPQYRALQPFGQVPIFEEDGLVLFESGAIVLHIGERSEALLPLDSGARARATQWLFAALNSIEPCIMNVAAIDLFHAAQEWAKLRRPGAVAFVERRLAALSRSLGDKPFLDGERFTAGDLMMATVLRILSHTDLVVREPRLAAYLGRCTARAAFTRALEAQLQDFKRAA